MKKPQSPSKVSQEPRHTKTSFERSGDDILTPNVMPGDTEPDLFFSCDLSDPLSRRGYISVAATAKLIADNMRGILNDEGQYIKSLQEAMNRLAREVAADRLSGYHPQTGLPLDDSDRHDIGELSGMISPATLLAVDQLKAWARQKGVGMLLTEAELFPKESSTRSRRTLLTIIAALCKANGISITEKGASQRIANLTSELGCQVSDDTVRSILLEIPDAVERNSK